MTIKLVGTHDGVPSLFEVAAEVAMWKDVTTHMNEQLLGMNRRLLAVEALAAKVKDDTDGALLMLEGRIHAIEAVNAVAHELPPATSAKRSAKS